MKKLIITCALLTSASLVSFAQTTPTTPATSAMSPAQRPMPQQMTAEQRAERRAKMEEKQLSLNPDQYKTVYNADLEMVKKMEEMKASGKPPARADFEAISATREEKIKKVLTPDQLTKFESMNNRMQKAPQTPSTPPAPAGVK